MSDEYIELENRINRMTHRKELAIKVISDLQSIIAEVDTDIQAMKLQLAALRYEGDDAKKK